MAPAILHVTHPKSGSTWITDILRRLAGERFVAPEADLGHLREPLEPGLVYPRVYLPRERVEALEAPGRTELLLTIRDLRDTIVSAYWSLRESHVEMPNVGSFREQLQSRSLEDGLIWLMDAWAPSYVAAIQRSWAGEPRLVRYEEILADDVGVLVPELSGRLELGDPEEVRRAIELMRFERFTGGRARGIEDRTAHRRKGVAGDWRNYMAEGPVRDACKDRFAELLIETGYERDADW